MSRLHPVIGPALDHSGHGSRTCVRSHTVTYRSAFRGGKELVAKAGSVEAAWKKLDSAPPGRIQRGVAPPETGKPDGTFFGAGWVSEEEMRSAPRKVREAPLQRLSDTVSRIVVG